MNTTKPTHRNQPFVYKNMIVLFAVVICCFTAWGIAADMTAPMVAAFKRIFTMSTFQASLVSCDSGCITLFLIGHGVRWIGGTDCRPAG
jgi:fucose permease